MGTHSIQAWGNFSIPKGAHPGISNQSDALFRLQAVVVTARWLLKRHESVFQDRAAP
jgi:hypothetical protein